MPSRKGVGARQRPGQSVCSREAFAAFLNDLLSEDFFGFALETRAIERCREQLLHALEVYRSAKSYDANYILQEMRELHQVAHFQTTEPSNCASKPNSAAACKYRKRIAEHYHSTCESVEKLSIHARKNLVGRLRNRSACIAAAAINTETLLPPQVQSDGAVSLLPQTQRAYCQLVASLCRSGMRYAIDDDGKPKGGRRRPSGNRSRAPLIFEPFGPSAQPQPQKKSAERELESFLALAWWELTGNPVCKDASNATRKDAKYIAFVEAVFEQVGSEENTNASKWVKKARRQVDLAGKESATLKF